MAARQRNCAFLIALCFLVMPFLSDCQSPAQFMKAGDKAVEEKKWDEAFSYFEQGYALDSGSFELAWRFADAARNIRRYKLAESLYQKNYDKDNGQIQPNGLYWLAMMQKNLGKYEDAQRNFKKYIKKHKATADRELIKQAEKEVKSAVWAMDNVNKHELVDAKTITDQNAGLNNYLIYRSRLPDEVNTEQSEITSFMLDSILFFSSFNDDQWKLKAAKWTPPLEEYSPLSSPLNSASIENVTDLKMEASLSNANFKLDKDRRKCYFSRSNATSTSIMVANWVDGEMKDILPMDLLNKEGTTNTMPCPAIVKGEPWLFFVSDREGGEGGLDIWYVKWKGEWSKPKNAGGKINTEGDEITPFINGETFYFASNHHKGFGGFDIFSSRYNESFSIPENVGSVYNSSYDDFGWIKDENETLQSWSFFTSNRPVSDQSDDACCNDIYAVKEFNESIDSKEHGNPAHLTVTLDSLMRELPVVLYFHNDEPNPDSWDTTTTLSYSEAYDSYKKLVPLYLRENTKGLKGEKLDDAVTITNDFFELKVDKGKNDLTNFSDLLLKELQAGRSLNISVRGFASPRAQSDYNLNLTKRRTASLVNFLMQQMDGAFAPYIEDIAPNGARLTFTLLPFGEVQADKSVSDDLVDEHNSIYNRSACLERKIEIESVQEIQATLKKAEIKLDADTFDFGQINKYDPVRHVFNISNEGNAVLKIDSVIAECGCTDPKIQKQVLLPNESTQLDVGFSPFGSKNKVEKHVMIYIAGEEPKLITIRAEILK